MLMQPGCSASISWHATAPVHVCRQWTGAGQAAGAWPVCSSGQCGAVSGLIAEHTARLEGCSTRQGEHGRRLQHPARPPPLTSSTRSRRSCSALFSQLSSTLLLTKLFSACGSRGGEGERGSEARRPASRAGGPPEARTHPTSCRGSPWWPLGSRWGGAGAASRGLNCERGARPVSNAPTTECGTRRGAIASTAAGPAAAAWHGIRAAPLRGPARPVTSPHWGCMALCSPRHTRHKPCNGSSQAAGIESAGKPTDSARRHPQGGRNARPGGPRLHGAGPERCRALQQRSGRRRARRPAAGAGRNLVLGAGGGPHRQPPGPQLPGHPQARGAAGPGACRRRRLPPARGACAATASSHCACICVCPCPFPQPCLRSPAPRRAGATCRGAVWRRRAVGRHRQDHHRAARPGALLAAVTARCCPLLRCIFAPASRHAAGLYAVVP